MLLHKSSQTRIRRSVGMQWTHSSGAIRSAILAVDKTVDFTGGPVNTRVPDCPEAGRSEEGTRCPPAVSRLFSGYFFEAWRAGACPRRLDHESFSLDPDAQEKPARAAN